MSTPLHLTGSSDIDTRALPESVTLRAVEWMVALQAADADAATRAAWLRWRDEHPDHELAWRHIETAGARLRAMPSAVTHGVLVREATQSGRQRRRRALKTLCVGAMAGTGAWLAREDVQREWMGWRADYRTATGERRAIVLPDGTQVELDTATAMDVRFDASVRRVHLLHGRVLITTAQALDLRAATEDRPFEVVTDHGRLQALGTRFSVRQDRAHIELAVFDGAVAVRPGTANDASIVVQAGEQVRFDKQGVGKVERAPAAGDAWVNGMLVAHDLPLGDVVAELSRYRTGLLRCDPAIAQLKVSGVYPLADSDRVLDMLSRTLPIDVSWRTRYWVTLQPSTK
jgi:transmembrane sensor